MTIPINNMSGHSKTPQMEQALSNNQSSRTKEDFKSMDKSLFNYSARNKDGSKDASGKDTITYDDFSQEELSQINANNLTFKDAISSLIGKTWDLAGTMIDNVLQIFNGSTSNGEDTVNGHKVGERNEKGDAVWCNDGLYHKANERYEKDGITYVVNGNLAIISTGSKGSTTEYFKDGYKVTEDNGDGEYTVKAYKYKDGATATKDSNLEDLKSEDIVYEVDKYNNGAASVRRYDSENTRKGTLRNQNGIPKYFE